MSRPCRQFEKALRRGDAVARVSLAEHAAECGACRERMRLWEEISQAAPSMKKSWESHDLFPRIARAIAAERERPSAAAGSTAVSTQRPGRSMAWVPLAAAAALFVISMVGLEVFKGSRGQREIFGVSPLPKEPLLQQETLDEVERSEESYVASIRKLAEVAAPRLRQSGTPLMTSYREKLLLLDTAIEEVRTQLERNRFNTHLRRELLAMYQEKQRTLQAVMREAQS